MEPVERVATLAEIDALRAHVVAQGVILELVIAALAGARADPLQWARTGCRNTPSQHRCKRG